ncbi:MAG TPA: phosphate ABC transporter substrate-binding protein PstS [Ktedonobacterales bacterium]
MFDRLHAIRSITVRLAFGAVALTSLALAACGSPANADSGSGSCPSTNTLTGAGSTFDNPLFSKMFENYANAHCGAQVTYSSVGSGAGISQLLAQTVDFGATDSPMTDAQLQQSTNGPIIHIPITIGAVAMTYNLSQVGASTHIQLTGPVIADIFLGKVKFWDDAAIAQLNSGTTLPHVAITVVHRSDGSGTTGIFSHYLSAVSPSWQSQVGAGTTLNWPVGVGAKGNAGVAAQVKSTAGAIGYNELAYVLTNTIQYAQVQNAAGQYVLPSLDGAKAAANNVTSIPADLRFFIVNAPGATSYPISGFSWVIVYQTQKDSDKGRAVANMLWWMTHDGQQYSTSLSYVPLPATIVAKDEAQIKSITCGGKACYQG